MPPRRQNPLEREASEDDHDEIGEDEEEAGLEHTDSMDVNLDDSEDGVTDPAGVSVVEAAPAESADIIALEPVGSDDNVSMAGSVVIASDSDEECCPCIVS